MSNNIFKEINEKASIINIVNTYGLKLDRQKRCTCFLHSDKEPSLQIHEETNTWWCYVCGEGYTPIDFVMKKEGITALEAAKQINKDLNLGINIDNFNSENEKLTKVSEYFYRRVDGSVTMKVEKWVKPSTGKKEFYPYALKDGKYIKGYSGKLDINDYVLYNLQDVVNSDVVFFTEGEKDADTLKQLGYAGTTTPGGGRGLKSYYKNNPNLFEPVENKSIRIVSDNDEVGSEYINQILECIKDKVKDIKVFNLCNVMPNLKKKGDITDVFVAVGKEKTLKYLKELEEKTEYWTSKIETVVEEENTSEDRMTREYIFSIEMFDRLYNFEINSEIEEFFKTYNEIKNICQKKRFTGFDKAYKMYKDSKREQYVYTANTMTFPGLNNEAYAINRYEMSPDGTIYEVIPNVGKVLVCYHPIVPVEKFKNVEDGIEKVKIAYFTDYTWNYIIVDKSTISSTQSIVKLSDVGIAVTSENAKFLVKYLSEIENLNKDKIKTNISVSRLGWINGKLIPYNSDYKFDNDKDLPHLDEKFGEMGTLEDWADFFRERRKFNDISRIIMASSVASILLKKMKQSGFTLHVWGESEFGKTVACMVGQSMFGNPSQNDNRGVGINFNFTNAGLEYRLNLYNDIPLFINEMQHQKDAKDYDKMLFLISEGKGKSRSTKTGGIGKENSWNNIVITNGEKNIIKYNSDNGAYNRCLSCEITKHSFENLSEVADFCKENYGTVIREILKHLDEFDLKAIYKEKLALTEEQDISNKQKIIEAIIMTGDKILTDIIFKDEYYLNISNFKGKVVGKEQLAIEERAYECVIDWYISLKRHFLDKDGQFNLGDKSIDIYGKEMEDGYLAIISNNLKDVLEDNGYDYNQIISMWRRKYYTKCEADRNTKSVRINGTKTRCIVLDIERNNRDDDLNECMEMLPF